MAKSLKRTRELLSRADLVGFDTSAWAAAAAGTPGAIRSSAAKVGGKAGPKVGTKAGAKAGPARS